MLISVLTGVAAGAVHVVGGADHLVAMAPFSLNRPLAACRSALAWGAGPSAGVVVLALIAIGLKDFAHVEAMSSWAEFLVGVALLSSFGIGQVLPLLLAGTFAAAIPKLLALRGISRWVPPASGVVLLTSGLLTLLARWS